MNDAMSAVDQNLHITNPCMRQVLYQGSKQTGGGATSFD